MAVNIWHILELKIKKIKEIIMDKDYLKPFFATLALFKSSEDSVFQCRDER